MAWRQTRTTRKSEAIRRGTQIYADGARWRCRCLRTSASSADKSVRGHRRVQPSVAHRLGEAALVLDVVQVFGAELFDRGDDGADGGVAEGAEGLAADVVGHRQQQVGVLFAAFAALDAVENRFEPVCAFAAR